MRSSLESVIATLELVGSEHSDLLDFQVDLLFNSAMRFAMIDLAVLFDVERPSVGATVRQACLDLDKLERGPSWRHPREVIDSPNLLALFHACRARAARVQGISRGRRLEAMAKKLDTILRRAWAQDWLGTFMGWTTSERKRKPGATPRGEAGTGAEEK